MTDRKTLIVAALAASFSIPNPAVAQGQQLPPPDLSGVWDDAGRPVDIVQNGSAVIARFAEPPLCDPRDGSTPRPRDTDFEAVWTGDTLKGQVSVCNWGEKWGARIGIQKAGMWLVLSQEGRSLEGEYEGWEGWAPFELTRDCQTASWPEITEGTDEGPDMVLPAGWSAVERTPVSFEAFSPEDLGPCRSPDEEVTLPNGVRMTLARYLAVLNHHERRLNAHGVTLRDRVQEEAGPQVELAVDPSVIVRPVIEKTEIDARVRERVAERPEPGGRIPNLQTEIQRARSARGGAMGLRPSTAAPPLSLGEVPGLAEFEGGLGRHEAWNLPLGDEAAFFVGIDGEFSLSGAADRTSLGFETAANGAVVGNRFELLSLTGEMISPVSEPMHVALDLRVLGNEYRLLNETLSVPTDWSESKTVPVETSWNTRFTIAGIGIDATLGVRGESGVGFFAGLLPGSLIGVAGPFASVKGFLDISADLEIGRISAYSDLTLLEYQLVLWGAAQLQLDANQRPYVWMDYYALNDMNALDGEAGIEVCYWILDWKGWREKCQHLEIWDFLGYRSTDYLFRGTETVYLE